MTQRVLVTGGSGFIGTNVIASHVAAGDDVVNLDIAAPRNTAHKHLWRQIDLLRREQLIDTVSSWSPDVIYHLAARTDLHGVNVSDYSVNVEGVQNLVDAVNALSEWTRIVFASSRMVCRIDHRPTADDEYSPPNAYGESKRLGELIVRERNPASTWSLVRPTSIWGPWFDVPYRDFFQAVRGGRYMHPKGMAISKSFGYVGNTVHQLHRIAAADSKDVRGRTFYLGDYPPIEVSDMADRIAARSGSANVRRIPVPTLRIAARLGDAARVLGWKEPPLTSFRLANLLTPMVYDLSTLEDVVGPLPYSLEEGIESTVEWMDRTVGAK